MNLLFIFSQILLLQSFKFSSTNSRVVPARKIATTLRQPRDMEDFRNESTSFEKSLLPPSVYRCGETATDLVLNFVNQNFPEHDADAGDCRFRLIISSPHICQIRVDFVDTEMVAPTRGDCLTQLFEVEGATWPTGLPPLCGIVNDQHFYLHLEPWSANTSYLDFKLVTAVSGKPYRFGMWLTQIDCTNFNVLRAPDGCTQYFLREHGHIKTLNFEGLQNLNGQNYRICIRPGKGVCGIRYDSKEGEFNVRKNIPAGEEMNLKSGTGPSVCDLDYVLIPDGRRTLIYSESARKSKLLWSRPASIIIVNPDLFRPEVMEPMPVETTTKSTTTTTEATTTQKSKPKVRISDAVSSSLTGFADRFCGGALSTFGDETTNKPIFARVASNLIILRVRTSTSIERKTLNRNEFPGLQTGFRIYYNQLRQCEENFPDLAAQPNIMHLIQISNPSILISDFSSSRHNRTDPFNRIKLAADDGNVSEGLSNSSYKRPSSDEISWEYLEGGSHESPGRVPAHSNEDDYDLYDF